MSYRKAHIIECDQCGAETITSRVSKRQALKRATEAGWDIGPGSMADLCPCCAHDDAAFGGPVSSRGQETGQ